MPYDPSMTPDAPLPISMLPDAEPLTLADLLLLTQPTNTTSRSRRLDLNTLLDFIFAQRVASTSQAGGIKVGDTLSIVNGILDLKDLAVTTDKIRLGAVTKEKLAAGLWSLLQLVDDQGSPMEGTTKTFSSVAAGESLYIGNLGNLSNGSMVDMTIGFRVEVPQASIMHSLDTFSIRVWSGTPTRQVLYKERNVLFNDDSVEVRQRMVFEVTDTAVAKLSIKLGNPFSYNRLAIRNISLDGWVY